jgi:osmotically-inducible protein OsmY
MIAAVVAISVAGCTRQSTSETAGATGDAAQAVPTSDAALETSVRARLYSAGATRDSDIDVSATDGVVTLTGAVEKEAVEQQALAVARGTDGVTRVENQLAVATSGTAGPPDRGARNTAGAREGTSLANTPGWITTKIQAQYFINPEIKPWNIDVTTLSGGVVELRGEVDSAEDQAQAVQIARSTEGVTRVEDYLRVRGETAQRDAGPADAASSDLWITAKVQAKYFLDADVKASDVDVTTHDGIVTLEGAVETEEERRQALAIARNTDGVREVRDQLRVAADTQNDRRGTSASGALAGFTDPWITTKIQSKYFLDSEVKGHRIDVDTRNGVVTLTGTVASEMRRQLAEQIARDTSGVTRVINRLTVAAQP